MRPALPIVVFAAFIAPLFGANPAPSLELLFPQFAVGGGWECELTLIVQGAGRSTGLIGFFDQQGQRLTATVDGEISNSVHGYDLQNGSATTMTITKDDDVEIGYLVVSQAASAPNRQSSIGGILTYRYVDGGEVRMQIGVPASQSLYATHIPYNNVGGNRTAFAILSVNRVPVTMVRHDEAGNVKASSQIEFQGFTQTARFVDEAFPSSRNTRGFLKLSSPDSFQILILNQNGSLLSTSVSMPGLLERNLSIETSGESSDWTLRLIQEGFFLYGLTSMPGEEAYSLATGIWLGGMLQINMFGFDQGPLNYAFLATSGDLTAAQGTVTVLAHDGTVVDTGTFQMTKPSQAPF